MKKYIVKIDIEREVSAENKDEVLSELEEQFSRENTTAENQFWDNCEIEEVK